MGQTSQIYVRYQVKGQHRLVARYFSWNYGDRMVSRARHTLEWLLDYHKNGLLHLSERDTVEKLVRIIDTNFDYEDIMLSSDIVNEWNNMGRSSSFADYVFYNQDNSDGKLFIDVLDDGVIHYAFTDSSASADNIMDALAYMDWNIEGWKEREYSEYETVDGNARYISASAELMTADELKDFINCDYGFEENGQQYGIRISDVDIGNAASRIRWFDTMAERDSFVAMLRELGVSCEKWVSALPFRLDKLTWDTGEIDGLKYIQH